MKKIRKLFGRKSKVFFFIMATLVTFVTVYNLVLPAITIDEDTAVDDPSISNETLLNEEGEKKEEPYDPVAVEQQREEEYKEQLIDAEEDQDEEEHEIPETVVQADLLRFYDDSTNIIVYVEAPIEAFPEGTYMIVEPIEEDEIIETVNETLESGRERKLVAVDISFRDAEGNEIEPACEIKVSLTSDLIRKAKDTQIIHIDDEGEGSIVEQSEEESEPDEIVFESKDFSTYVVVVETDVITADGDSYKITVTYDEEANLPDNVSLDAREIMEGEEYELYWSAIAEELDTDIGYVRLFDISILNHDGEKIQPDALVSVKIELNDLYGGNLKALHFADKGEIEVIDNIKVNEEAISFETDGFSVYGIVSDAGVSELDGKTFGIVNNQNSPDGYALMVNQAQTGVTALKLVVRTEPVSRTENVFVANNSDISMWTFSSVSGSADNVYYVTTPGSSDLKYLRIDGSNVSLVSPDAVDSKCEITVTKGTGTNAGKYRFTSNGYTLRFNKSGNNITFNAATSVNANSWMNFAELSNLNDDDFVVYTAEKVSVSDETNVHNGSQIIIYARIWNETLKKYEYYAIDYDGMLIKAYESGDTISWVGSKVNTMLWNFIQYGNTGYFDFENSVYSGTYLAPQVTEHGIYDETGTVHGRPIGVLLQGREKNQYFSTIIAWDNGDDFFDYSSLKIDDNGYTLHPDTFQKGTTFYFAVIKAMNTEENLTTVSTIDHQPFGITLKMQDYENITSYNRSKDQVDVLGNTDYEQWTGTKNLVTRNADPETHYPTSTVTGRSLYELFDKALTVNQQFLLSTYEETGYFEYDSTKNFCHLITNENDKWFGRTNEATGHVYEVGDFVIYDQLGTSDEGNKDTLKHGQFFPYNDITDHFDEEGNPVPVTVSTKYRNEMDIHAEPLSSLDPRLGEDLYSIHYQMGKTAPNYVDHFFGMEMSASFMQSEGGVDAWGHDLIFEFSGDDDFWLYVDDILVLDLGGIHSALDASINFKTGQIIENKRETTIREVFKQAYLEKYPDPTAAGVDDVETWLNKIFKNGGTVFNDYSGHTMRMFYLERGAGASNLKMRFNLAPYTNGEVLLEKEVTGTKIINQKYGYQIFAKYPALPEENEPTPYLCSRDDITVVDYNTKEELDDDYLESYSPVSGLTYENVFFLSPGQTVSILFPDSSDNASPFHAEDTEYYIREICIDQEKYDKVRANNELLSGEETDPPVYEDGILVFRDYPIVTAKVSERKKVIYENHVKASALKTLTITKRLWQDFDRLYPIYSGDDPENDNTEFIFRIYIGVGNGDTYDKIVNGVKYAVYNAGKYYVKGPDGCYCIFQGGRYVSTHKSNLSELSTVIPPGELKSELDKATFTTSRGGGADRIRAGYSVEIPDLMNGTIYYVEENSGEVPSGYNMIGYNLTKNAYVFPYYDADHDIHQGQEVNYGTINSVEDPAVITIHNQHGYGLVMNKHWSDADFMEYHDYVYYGVYLKDGDTETLIDGSIRQLGRTETSIRWFFPELENGKTLNDYLVYELSLALPEGTEVQILNDGTVILPEGTVITKIDGEDIKTIIVEGKPSDHGYSSNFEYTVSYEREILTEQQIADRVNSRTDDIYNDRPGIKILKTDITGNKLPGATFTLMKEDDENTVKTFVSDEDGLVVVAYLTEGETYILEEVSPPFRYRALIQEPLSIMLGEDGNLYVNGETQNPENGYYSIVQVAEPTIVNMPTLTIKNQPISLIAKKLEMGTDNPIEEGIRFALYKEVLDYYNNLPMPNYTPLERFESLSVGEGGIIENIDLDHLQPGVYYLREIERPNTYYKLPYDIRITISETGETSIQSAIYSTDINPNQWVFNDISDETAEVYENENDGTMILKVRNIPSKIIRIKKIDMESKDPLAGCVFDLYKIGQIDMDTKLPKDGEVPFMHIVSDDDGIVLLGALDDNITYYLYEIEAPDGYILLSNPVIISTRNNGDPVATLNDVPLEKKVTVSEDGAQDIYTFTLANSKGYVLPASGSCGTSVYHVSGMVLIVVASLLFVINKKKN